MSLFSNSDSFSSIVYSPSTTTLQVDSTTDINAGVTQVTDISDAYNTSIFRYDNSIRDNSVRMLDSLNTVFNAPAISLGGGAENLSRMGLDLSQFFAMPTTGQTAKLNPGIADGFFDSAANPAAAGGVNVKTLLFLALVVVGVWILLKRKGKK